MVTDDVGPAADCLPLESYIPVPSLAGTKNRPSKRGNESMRFHQWISAPVSKTIALALVVALLGAVIAFVDQDHSSQVAVPIPAKLEATIFAYDGHDFVRTKTTLLTKEGKSAVNTKLEHDNPAYTALVQKRSYTGDATIFGRKYDANYAPLTSDEGRLTGALFVAVAK